MTLDKDRKRIIRTRKAETGESYTTARTHVLAKARPASPAPCLDYSALSGIADDRISEKTGRTWQEWTRLLALRAAHEAADQDGGAEGHGLLGRPARRARVDRRGPSLS